MSLHIKKIPYREYARNGLTKTKENVRTIIKVLSLSFSVIMFLVFMSNRSCNRRIKHIQK